MQTDNRILDDVARVTSGALGMLARVKDEIGVLVRQQLDNLLGNMELVSREEFEAVKETAAKARAEQEDLAARVAALEARLGPAERGKTKR
ncbi:MAG TPA: accessory factor UbiK family protein [Alphaproteobacteria bacterium]|jgi:BMFP domain-containing protein YqiC|nr:accessory factor UbiK family protein [Alphaproteobacteria bacterium]